MKNKKRKGIKKMKISICIPTYEQHGQGGYFIKQALESIKNQTFKNFEVVISDHSNDNVVKNVVKKYSADFEIKYVKNSENYGNGPANTNNCINHSTGDILKFLFQDDFFYDNNALKIIEREFRYGAKWVVTGSNHTIDFGKSFQNVIVPRWNKKILLGVNTISSPSVLAMINDKETFFDKNLVMLMDCEFYYQLFLKYGEPTIIKNTLMTNTLHDNQISRLFDNDIKNEIAYVKNKHNIRPFLFRLLSI